MKRVFLDTNIIIDVLDRRESFFVESSNILSLGAEGKLELYATSLTFTTCVYVLRKRLGYTEIVDSIRLLRTFIHVSPMNEAEFDLAFAKDVPDVEDMLQYYSAVSAGCDVVITRNGKHFPTDGIPIMTPFDFLVQYEYCKHSN